MHKTSQNVLDHGNNNVTIIIACSNLSNLGFFARFCTVNSWITVDHNLGITLTVMYNITLWVIVQERKFQLIAWSLISLCYQSYIYLLYTIIL